VLSNASCQKVTRFSADGLRFKNKNIDARVKVSTRSADDFLCFLREMQQGQNPLEIVKLMARCTFSFAVLFNASMHHHNFFVVADAVESETNLDERSKAVVLLVSLILVAS
jgi:hypothetical protein